MKLLLTVLVSLLVVAQAEAGPKTKKQARKTASSDIATRSTQVITDANVDPAQFSGVFFARDACNGGDQSSGLVALGVNGSGPSLTQTAPRVLSEFARNGDAVTSLEYDYVYIRRKNGDTKFKAGTIKLVDVKEITTINLAGPNKDDMEEVSREVVLQAANSVVNGDLANDHDDGTVGVRSLSANRITLHDERDCDERVNIYRPYTTEGEGVPEELLDLDLRGFIIYARTIRR